MSQNKIIFAQQLRGFACLFVIISHWLGVFNNADLISNVTRFPLLDTAAYNKLSSIATMPYLNFGPLGVAIFFLISGFVIPFGLQKMSFGHFMISRIFRIYPTYIICLSITAFCLMLSAAYWKTPTALSPFTFATNALLVHNLFVTPSIDLVNWTLSIEVKFYLIAALIFQGNSIRNIIIYIMCALIIAIGAPHLLQMASGSVWSGVIATLSIEAYYITFMLVGICFYWHFTNRMSNFNLIVLITFIMIVFTISWALGIQKEQFYVVTINYFYGLVLFFGCYVLKNHFIDLKSVDFFANISYPLYLTHSIIGYILLQIALLNHVPYFLALSGVFIITTLLAYFVHFLIEVPSNNYGKKIVAKLKIRCFQARSIDK